MTIGRHGRIPLAPEGLPFIIPLACLAVVSALLGWWVVAVAMGLAAICMVAFFRDPEGNRVQIVWRSRPLLGTS